MRLKNTIRIHHISALSVVCSIAFVCIALIVRICTGSPYKIINYCGLKNVIPPVWLMALMWCFWYAVLGITFGTVIGSKRPQNEVSKYKGGMIFIIMLSLGYVWYPLFFGSAALFLSLLVCEIVFVLSVICAVYFSQVNRYSSFAMIIFSLWMLCMVILNIVALLNC